LAQKKLLIAAHILISYLYL